MLFQKTSEVNNRLLPAIPILLYLLSACISNKKLVYFPDPAFNTKAPTEIINRREVYKLQPRDVLSIRVKTLDTESANYFNIQSEGGFQQINPAGLYLNGYSIDEAGYIEFPEVGRVQVKGLTVNEAQNLIREKIGEYLANATILVKLVSFKITVLGEVNKPGYYYVFNEQATILEGLGLAGDLTDFGNRKNITLIRQVEDGSEAILLNLKDPDLIKSKYYYLLPNDVVYVQPLEEKNIRSNLGTLGALSILFGAISSTILLLRYLNPV